jgi:hypothetical protein
MAALQGGQCSDLAIGRGADAGQNLCESQQNLITQAVAEPVGCGELSTQDVGLAKAAVRAAFPDIDIR